MSTEEKPTTSPAKYQEIDVDHIWFSRLQEVLLMHRPFCFCCLLFVIELIFGFVYFLNLGIFATIALLGLIGFMCFIHFEHPNPLFSELFFPPLKKPIDQTQPNRIRSYEEFSNAIYSINNGFSQLLSHKQLTGIKRVMFGVCSFICALLLKRVVPFWVNFLLVHGILFLPSAILRPWPTKDAPNEDTKQAEKQKPNQTQNDENNSKNQTNTNGSEQIATAPAEATNPPNEPQIITAGNEAQNTGAPAPQIQ